MSEELARLVTPSPLVGSPPQPQAPQGGGMDWRAVLRTMGPAVLAMTQNPQARGAFLEGMQEAQQRVAARKAQEQEQEQARQRAAGQFRLSVFEQAQQITDPQQWASFVNLATDTAQDMGLIRDPWELRSHLVYPSHLAKQRTQAEIEQKLAVLEKQWEADPKQLLDANPTITLKDGTRMKYQEAKTIVGAPQDDAGQFLVPAKPKPTPTAPSDYEQSFERWLRDHGKTMEVATSADEMAFRKAQKDSTVDPDMAGLNKTLKELQVDAARQRAATGSESADLMNELRRLRIDQEKQKLAEAGQATDQKRAAATRIADEITAEIDKLIDPVTGKLTAGAQAIVGLRVPFADRVPGSKAADAKASLDRVTGQMVVDLIREMKDQSRTGATGFGALSERELSLLQSAATKLSNRNMSEAAFAAELKRIRDKVQLIHGAQPAQAGGRGRVYYDANGNPVQR